MNIIVEFSLNVEIGRRTPIKNKYRSDWVSQEKPRYNCAYLYVDGDIFPGETKECQLEPLCPEFWWDVKVGSVLVSLEGKKEIGKAIVKEII